MHICVQVCSSVCVHIEARGLTVDIFLYCSSLYHLKQGLTEPGCHCWHSDCLASEPLASICVLCSPSSLQLFQVCTLRAWPFHGFWGSELTESSSQMEKGCFCLTAQLVLRVCFLHLTPHNLCDLWFFFQESHPVLENRKWRSLSNIKFIICNIYNIKI